MLLVLLWLLYLGYSPIHFTNEWVPEKKALGDFCEQLPPWLSVQIALYLYVKQKITWSHINNHLGQ